MLDWLKDILGESYTEEIDKAVSARIGKDFVSRSDFNDLNETKKELEKSLKGKEKDIESLKETVQKGGDVETALTELKAKYKADTEALEEKLRKQTINSAIENRLIKENAVNPKAVKALIDMEKVSFDNGNILGLEEQIAALKESEKWAFSKPVADKGFNPPPGASDADKLKQQYADAEKEHNVLAMMNIASQIKKLT